MNALPRVLPLLTPEHGSVSPSSLDLIDRLITQTPDFSIALHVIDVTPVLLKPSQMQAFLAQQASRPVACPSIVVPPEYYSSSVEQMSADLILLCSPREYTFHFSISTCLLLYCLTRSSSTFRRPSEFVLSAGMTSFTVLSTRTPFIIRKHFLSAGSGSRVSSTNLCAHTRAVRKCFLKSLWAVKTVSVNQEGQKTQKTWEHKRLV
jgi:hypothetical protein